MQWNNSSTPPWDFSQYGMTSSSDSSVNLDIPQVSISYEPDMKIEDLANNIGEIENRTYVADVTASISQGFHDAIDDLIKTQEAKGTKWQQRKENKSKP